MSLETLSLSGYYCERRDRQGGRGGGVACYVRSDVAYQRLTELENGNQEVLWLKLTPKRLRKYSCILVGVVYHPPGADNCDLREYLITCIDITLRSYPECGALIPVLGDLNQMHDSFLSTHYGYRQVVNKPTQLGAILDKIWTNLAPVYYNPLVLSQLGTSDHCMVLFSPSMYPTLDPGAVQRITTRCTGRNDKAAFASALAKIRWEPLYHTASCQGQFEYFQSSMDSLLECWFPYKTVSRHSTDKPWITDTFRILVRKRQRARMCADLTEARRLRNRVTGWQNNYGVNSISPEFPLFGTGLPESGGNTSSHSWGSRLRGTPNSRVSPTSCLTATWRHWQNQLTNSWYP